MNRFDPKVVRLLRPARREITAVVLASGLHSLLVVAQAFAVTGLVVALTQGDALRTWAVAVGVVVAARSLASWFGDLMASKAAAVVGVSVRRLVLAHALDLGPQWLSSHSTGSLVSLTTRGVSAIEPYLTRYVPALLLAYTLPVLTVGTIATQDLLSALIVVVSLPLVPVFAALVGWATQARARRQWRQMSALAGHFLDVVQGLPTLVAFRRADQQTGTIRRITHRYRRATLDTLRLAFASSAVLELVATISVALVAVSVGLRLAAGSLDLQTALVVLLLAPEAYWPLRRVGAEFHAAAEGAATFAEVSAVLDVEQPATGVVDAPDLRASTIRLTDVSLTYPQRRDAALGPVTAVIRPGEFVAVAGTSGAGKSTLLGILAGQLTPTGGLVDVGGVPVGAHDRHRWMSQVAWVPQRPWFGSGTVADNVRLGRRDATDAQVWAALRQVGLADVVAAMPGGLAAPVGEDGSALSAGERARLALARVVVSERPLVLLDEPTAHLDAETQDIVLATLRRLAQRSTVVVVTHRQAVLALADRILVLAAPTLDSATAVVSAEASDAPNRHRVRSVVGGDPDDRAADDDDRRGSWWQLALGIALGACAAGAGVGLTATAGWLIVRASERPPVLALLVAIIAVRTLGIARPVLRYAERLLSHDAALRTLAEERARVYAALIPLTPAALGRQRGDVLASVVDDVDAHVDLRLRVWAPTSTAAAVGVGASVALWFVHPAAALVLLVALAGCGAVGLLGGRWSASRAEVRFVDERAELSNRVTEVLQGSSELAAWGATTAALDSVDAVAARAAGSTVRAAVGAAAARALATTGLGIALVATALVVAPAVGTTVTPAMAALLVLVPLGLADVIAALADAGALSARSARSLQRLSAVLSAPPAVTDAAGPIALPNAGSRSVEVRAVTLGWGGTTVVSGLDIDVPPGRRLGVVGPSGSGKSTLAAALLRFVDPLAGVVALDQRDLRQLRTVDVRRSVGLVDDDPHIFSSTLAENVRLARPEATDADVQSALDQAHLRSWSQSLPDGLNTFLGDGAAAVSGGERARIALARSLLADQPVLVLDEPTAHLDSATARAVTDDLLDAASGRSIVLITHRHEDLERVDAIVELTPSVASRGASATHGGHDAPADRRDARQR